MKDAVQDVAGAISDVRDLLQAQAQGRAQIWASQPCGVLLASSDIDCADWRIEWLREVNKLLKMDAGWGWEQFFRMISYNIDPATIAAPVRKFSLYARVHAKPSSILLRLIFTGKNPPKHLICSRASASDS